MTDLPEPSLASWQPGEEKTAEMEQLQALEMQMVKLCQAVGSLQDQFTERIARDDVKRLAISKVVNRMEKLEADFLFKEFRKRLFLDLIMLYDRVVRLSKDITDADDILEAFGSIATELLQILKHQGVQRVEALSPKFDASIQQALDVVETPETSMDGTVSKILMDGFVYRDVLLRPQGVVIARSTKEEFCDE